MDLIPFSIFLIPILVLAIIIYISYRNDRKHKVNWEMLARFNNLNFTAKDSQQDQPSVTGKYRNYHLKLEAYKKGYDTRDAPYTRIVLTRERQEKSLREKRRLDQQVTLEDVVSRFVVTDARYPLRGRIEATPGGRYIRYEQNYVETEIEYLQYLFDLLANLADAYPNIIALGGRAVPFIEKHARLAIIKGNNGLHPIAVQLLKEIAPETVTRLSHQASHLLCSHCLAPCVSHKIELSPWETLTYYGCRVCSQSQNFMEWAGPVIAVLDNRLADVLVEEDGILRVNWLVRRALFDFEAVEIVQAADEDVEWFVVQIGNDTDPFRQARYQEMNCTVSPACNLSANTLRILRRMFGTVDKL